LSDEYKSSVHLDGPDKASTAVHASGSQAGLQIKNSVPGIETHVDAKRKENDHRGTTGDKFPDGKVQVKTSRSKFDVFELPLGSDTPLKNNLKDSPVEPPTTKQNQPNSLREPTPAREISSDLSSETANNYPGKSGSEATAMKETHVWPTANSHGTSVNKKKTKTEIKADVTDGIEKPSKPREPGDRDDDSVANAASNQASAIPSFGSRTFKQNSWGRKPRSTPHREKSRDQKQSRSTRSQIFGSATEARRQRKGRGVSAAAAAVVGKTESNPVDSGSLLESIVADYAVVKPTNPRKRDEILRDIPARLPSSWSTKLVNCLTGEHKPHRVMFLWSETELRLYVFDTATNSVKGAEIEAAYAEWELSPSQFQNFVTSNDQKGSRHRFMSRVWPFSQSRR